MTTAKPTAATPPKPTAATPPPRRATRLGALTAASLALAACGDDGSSGDLDAATGDLRTLDTCTTTIGAGVPAFYSRYFRCVTIDKTTTGVRITTQDLPPHLSYYWGAGDPNYTDFDTSRGAEYHSNPNSLSAQSIALTIPDAPTASGLTVTTDLVDLQAGTNAAEYPLGPIGVALDSVAFFSGVAAPGMSIADERFTFDNHEGHPTNNGIYHYHAPTPGPLEVLVAAGEATTTVPGAAAGELYGIMCDGTVLLGCLELDGATPTSLDAQGGHVGDLRAGDATLFFTARYHTHVCPDARGHGYAPEIQYHTTCGN